MLSPAASKEEKGVLLNSKHPSATGTGKIFLESCPTGSEFARRISRSAQMGAWELDGLDRNGTALTRKNSANQALRTFAGRGGAWRRSRILNSHA